MSLSERSSAGNWFTVEPLDATTFSIAEYGQWMKVHSYLFLGTERACLVDTGLGIGNIKTLITELTSLPITVISTHAHWDHIGNHDLFDDVWVHESERSWLSGGYANEIQMVRDHLTERPFTKVTPSGFNPESYRPPISNATTMIRDGQLIDLGGRSLKLFHTPGHSPGHVCLFEAKTGYLVTGDLLYQGTLLAGLDDSDPNAFFDSIQRMNRLPGITRLLPGHGKLEIDRSLLQAAENAFREVKKKEGLKIGSGLHSFERLLIRL